MLSSLSSGKNQALINLFQPHLTVSSKDFLYVFAQFISNIIPFSTFRMNIKEKYPLVSPQLFVYHNTSQTSKKSIVNYYSVRVSLNFVKTFQFWLTLYNKNKHLTSGMQKPRFKFSWVTKFCTLLPKAFFGPLLLLLLLLLLL